MDQMNHQSDHEEEREEESFFDDEIDIQEEYLNDSKNNFIEFPPYTVEIQDEVYSCATQTTRAFEHPSKVFTVDHNLHDCYDGTLIQKYHETVVDYIENINPSDLSVLRSDICERLQKRVKFQRATFGAVSVNIDEQPPNLYKSHAFHVSLYLSLYSDHFTLSVTPNSIEVSGSIDDETGRSLLFYISRGYLKPGLLNVLKNKNCTWYNGCLICEITDYRRIIPRSIRIHLKVSPGDIQQYPFESEQPVILAQNPLICLDPSPAVANLARAAMRDRLRWEPTDTLNESKLEFVARRRPDLFLNSCRDSQSPRTQHFSRQQQKDYRQRLIDSMLNPPHNSE